MNQHRKPPTSDSSQSRDHRYRIPHRTGRQDRHIGIRRRLRSCGRVPPKGSRLWDTGGPADPVTPCDACPIRQPLPRDSGARATLRPKARLTSSLGSGTAATPRPKSVPVMRFLFLIPNLKLSAPKGTLQCTETTKTQYLMRPLSGSAWWPRCPRLTSYPDSTRRLLAFEPGCAAPVSSPVSTGCSTLCKTTDCSTLSSDTRWRARWRQRRCFACTALWTFKASCAARFRDEAGCTALRSRGAPMRITSAGPADDATVSRAAAHYCPLRIARKHSPSMSSSTSSSSSRSSPLATPSGLLRYRVKTNAPEAAENASNVICQSGSPTRRQ